MRVRLDEGATVFANRIGIGHLVVLLMLWSLFTALTWMAVGRGLDLSNRRPGLVELTAVASILGPFTGAISRGGQGCCLDFSLSLMPYCASAVVAGLLVQFIGGSGSAVVRFARLGAWTLGLFFWFGGGIVSLGHALS